MIDITRPDLTQLATFLAVVREGGFARAARALAVSPPTVSYRINQLEADLGYALIEEPRRRTVLTPAGKALLDLASRFIPELDGLLEELEVGGPARSPLRLACAGAFGRNVVYPCLPDPAAPALRVVLLFRSLEQIFDLVEDGTVDLGIAYGTRVTSALEFRQIAREEFCLIQSSRAEPVAGGLAEIAARPFVAYEECDYVFGKWFGDVFQSAPVRLRTDSSFSRLEEVVGWVAAGRGVSIVPLHSAQAAVDEGAIVVVRPGGRPRSFNPEYAVTRPGWDPPPEAERLLRRITKAAPFEGEG